MKKVLSVLLAAAMVMGMSVASFAAEKEYSPATTGESKDIHNNSANFEWGKVSQFRDGEHVKTVDETVDLTLKEGDVLYFEIIFDGSHAKFAAPSNWILKIKNAEYVKDAALVKAKDVNGINNGLYAKVTLEDDFDAYEEDGLVEFYMYVQETDDNQAKSQYATVHYEFVDYTTRTLKADEADSIIKAEANKKYKLHKDEKKPVTFVFEIAEDILVSAKLWPGETYLLKGDVEAKWSKELSKEYDEDISVITLNTDMDIREVLVESKKDNKQIVEVVDGALVAVESEFVTKYEIIEDVELVKGYVADIDGDCTFAVIDADIELIVPEVEAEVEADKANPETGAADFVGAAVAMAVVSVAAAGALALKK